MLNCVCIMKDLILFLATAATVLQQPAAEVSIFNTAKHNHGHQYVLFNTAIPKMNFILKY